MAGQTELGPTELLDQRLKPNKSPPLWMASLYYSAADALEVPKQMVDDHGDPAAPEFPGRSWPQSTEAEEGEL